MSASGHPARGNRFGQLREHRPGRPRAGGGDYKLYLSPEFVETEADFQRLKPSMVRVGDVKTFKNFLVPVPDQIDPSHYTTVIIWCEAFGQFITAAKYN